MNADLAELVKEQNPDFIAVCGDMVNRGDPDTTKMKDVLEKAFKNCTNILLSRQP